MMKFSVVSIIGLITGNVLLLLPGKFQQQQTFYLAAYSDAKLFSDQEVLNIKLSGNLRELFNSSPHMEKENQKENKRLKGKEWNKSAEPRLNLNRSWHKGHSHAYNTQFYI